MAKPATLTGRSLPPWKALLTAARRSSDIRSALRDQLARWAADRGITAAAIYSAGHSVARRVAAVGDRFPDSFDGAGVAGGTLVELPSARLLVEGSAPPADDPSLLLLAAGVRIFELEIQLEERLFQARFHGVEIEALHEVGLAIAATLDLESLGAEVLMRAISLLDARVGALYLIEDGRYRLLSHFGGEAEASFEVDDVRVAAMLRDERAEEGSPVAGVRHLLAVPIELESDPRGLLLVADKESRHGVGPFPESDKRTLALFANQAVIALENAKLHRLALEKERLEREMELASEIQQQLLPKTMPEIEGYEVCGWNRPARQVGGDYFDMRDLGNDRWLLVVGDVTGKGMPAALMVSTLHTALHLLGDQLEIGPEMVSRLSRHIFESSSSNKFITMLLAELDRSTGVLRYLNAGHNPGIMVRSSGDIETMPSSGMPLGLVPGARFGDAQVELAAGDLVCLYSDGITEAADPSGEELQLRRLEALLIENRRLPLAELIARIDDTVSAWSAGQAQGDDQTVVLLRRGGG